MTGDLEDIEESTRWKYLDSYRALDSWLARRKLASRLTVFMNYGYRAPHSWWPLRAEQSLLDHVLNVVGGQSPRVIVEVGSGRGGNLDRMRRRWPSAYVVGIDMVAANLRADYRRFRRHLLLRANASQLPLSRNCTDMVLSLESSHSYNSLALFVEEAIRVLAPGGRFVLADFAPDTLWNGLINVVQTAGAEIVHLEDLTAGVLRARKRVGMAMPFIIGGRPPACLRTFMALPHSEPYRAMVDGRLSYRLLIARCAELRDDGLDRTQALALLGDLNSISGTLA